MFCDPLHNRFTRALNDYTQNYAKTQNTYGTDKTADTITLHNIVFFVLHREYANGRTPVLCYIDGKQT